MQTEQELKYLSGEMTQEEEKQYMNQLMGGGDSEST